MAFRRGNQEPGTNAEIQVRGESAVFVPPVGHESISTLASLCSFEWYGFSTHDVALTMPPPHRDTMSARTQYVSIFQLTATPLAVGFLCPVGAQ